MTQVSPKPSATRVILTAWLIAGTLDILCAFTQVYIMRRVNPVPLVLKYIASAVFGTEARKGGAGMMAAGLLFHYVIALGCVLVFYVLYPRIGIMRANKWLTAVVYALVVWMVTNLVIVPLSLVQRGPITFPNAFIAMAILILAIGLPVTFIIGAYLDRRRISRH